MKGTEVGDTRPTVYGQSQHIFAKLDEIVSYSVWRKKSGASVFPLRLLRDSSTFCADLLAFGDATITKTICTRHFVVVAVYEKACLGLSG